ncbi:MAG: glycosyltransferase family 2 protein [Pseudomonadota bacterium]|nr:glycosyltransferase family 2 protein [Pseudomonadota bacterium]
MPQTSGVLNALRRRLARALGRRPEPGARLDPAGFLAHAAALAAKAPPPPTGLWLSVLTEAPAPSAPGPAEFVACDLGIANAPARWNEAASRARAPYVARLDHGGRLAPFAAERIAAALAANPRGLYTDEVIEGQGVALKPAFDPVLLQAFDYFGRLAVWRREDLLALGGWRDSPDPDHDLALRFAAAAPPSAILHLPYPAYIGPARTPLVRPPAPAPRAWPKVSVVIPSRDAPELIGRALDGLFLRTDYPDFDVTVIDNGSTDPRTLALYARAPERLRVEIRPAPFNFSAAVNRGVALSDGALVLLLNNDVEIVEPGWLKEMVACFDYPRTGIVGAKLLYPDGTLQHAGVIAGLGGYAGHWHIGRAADAPGPQGRLRARQSLSVVTGACLLASRACFDQLGGFDEQTFPIAYNDVDFCLRAGAAGWRVVWTPLATLIHHESASRGSDETGENRARFARDKAALQARHHTDALEDRAYNPWASRSDSDPWPCARADLPPAR